MSATRWVIGKVNNVRYRVAEITGRETDRMFIVDEHDDPGIRTLLGYSTRLRKDDPRLNPTKEEAKTRQIGRLERESEKISRRLTEIGREIEEVKAL